MRAESQEQGFLYGISAMGLVKCMSLFSLLCEDTARRSDLQVKERFLTSNLLTP